MKSHIEIFLFFICAYFGVLFSCVLVTVVLYAVSGDGSFVENLTRYSDFLWGVTKTGIVLGSVVSFIIYLIDEFFS